MNGKCIKIISKGLMINDYKFEIELIEKGLREDKLAKGEINKLFVINFNPFWRLSKGPSFDLKDDYMFLSTPLSLL